MLPPALTAIGNRTWGTGHHAIGLFIMTMASVIHYGALWAPTYAVTLYLFRFKGTGATWLAAERGENISGAILRGALILPYAASLYLVDHQIHWLGLAFPVIALFYWGMGRIWPAKATEVAELLTGAFVGAI